MIDRAEPPAAQQLGQLVRIRLVALIALRRLAAPIAHQDPVDHRDQEIVESLRLRAFLERDVKGAAHAAEPVHD